MNAPFKPGSKYRLAVSPSGKVHLPAELRKKLSVEKGGKLYVHEDEDGFKLLTIEQSLDAICDMVAPFVKGASIEKYLAEKRAEAQREWEDHR